MVYARQAEALLRHLSEAPFASQLSEAAGKLPDIELWGAIIEQAARYAGSELDPLGQVLDRDGARVVEGRVVTSEAHRRAWTGFREGGWITLSLPVEAGGQGLPLAVTTACEEIFNRSSPAFMMLPTPNRTAAALLDDLAPRGQAERWTQRLADGSWGATICISEPDAGSDVGRIRTKAVRNDDGGWTVTGEKCWISFGDHDLTERIGHCLLARTNADPGPRGLSLFLVPNTTDEGADNAIKVRRIEEKMGLHGSPTCVLGFEGSIGTLLGSEGRGLQHLFHMMLLMRLSCGPQGTGVATAAYETALAYARDRRQGGPSDAPAVPIASHADVQRLLLDAAARIETARGAAIAAANVMDLSRLDRDEKRRLEWSALAQFLLPIVKDGSARCAVDVANIAIQVLGGAGYTREWPVERLARDARVFPVFEGTSGMQALDMLHRRLWRDRGAGLAVFLRYAREDAGAGMNDGLQSVLDELEETAGTLSAMRHSARDAEAGADAFLRLCELAVCGWIAVRIVNLTQDDGVARRMKAASHFYLHGIASRARALSAAATGGAGHLAGFDALLD